MASEWAFAYRAEQGEEHAHDDTALLGDLKIDLPLGAVVLP